MEIRFPRQSPEYIESVIACFQDKWAAEEPRMDLYPWLAALYIEESHRGKNPSKRLIEISFL